MAKAKQLPSGNWRVQASVSVNGQVHKRSFTEPTAKKAEQAAEQWQEHIRMIGQDSSQMTVGEAILLYCDMNKATLSPSTLAGYHKIYEHGLPDLINKRLCSLTCSTIKNSMAAALQNLSPKTVKNRYGLLQTLLSTYYPTFVWNVKYPKQKKPKKRIFSDEYIKQVFQALKGTNFEVEAYLGMLSMRASEVAGAKWTDIDFYNKTLHVCRTKLKNENKQYVIVDSTKTEKSDRIVYLPDYVCLLLQQRRAQSKSEFISTVNPDSYYKTLNRILEKNGVEKISFHGLRHVYSTVSSRLGIDVQIRMENGGWSSEKIMDGNYRHPMSEAQMDANEKMNTYIGNLSDQPTAPPAPKRLRLKRTL